jgi:Zn-dependent protease
LSLVIIGAIVVLDAGQLDNGRFAGFARYEAAAAFILMLYASVLLHELGHSLAARGFGLPVRRIVLNPLGGMSEIERDPPTPVQEFVVSGAGPLVSLVLGIASLWLRKLFGDDSIPWTVLNLLMWVNLFVAAFNALPGLPLDGGRMLRAVVWKLTGRPADATICAGWIGRFLAIALFAVGPWLLPRLVGGDTPTSWNWICAGAVSAFIWVGAGQAIRVTRFRARLPELQARKLARKAISVQASTPLAEAIRQADEARARAVVVVDHDSKPIAILNETAVMATPPQRRPWIEAGSLARSIEPNLILPADISGMELLEAMRRAPAGEYLLVEPSGQVYGVLAARDLDSVFAGV